MNKDQLQQELLAKIKPGTKPSDLKKQAKNSQIPTPPPSPIIEPVDKKTKLKPSKTSISLPPIEIEQEQATNRDKSLLKNTDKILIKQLQEQANYWSQTANNYLTNLQTTMAKLDQTELTNQELQAQNKKLTKTIASLEKHTNNPANIQSQETKPTSFTCSSCTRVFNIELIRLIKKSGKKICRNCTLLMLKRANQFHGQQIVLKVKKSLTNQTQAKTFPCQTCLQTSAGEPHPVHVANFQEQGINPRQLTSICSTCLNEKVSLANFYCPRTSEGRDTYDPKEPQFDCDCPTNERSLT